MSKYRVVEYSQNSFGVALSKILPESLQPAMRDGEPQVLSGNLDLETASKIRDQRINQVKYFGRRERVSIEIEELF